MHSVCNSAAGDTYYALKAVGLWRWVIDQIVRGFPQSAGHIKLAAEFDLIESVNHLMAYAVANEWESLACDL